MRPGEVRRIAAIAMCLLHLLTLRLSIMLGSCFCSTELTKASTLAVAPVQAMSDRQADAAVFLLDSILKDSRRPDRPTCGPGSAADIAFRAAIPRVLPR